MAVKFAVLSMVGVAATQNTPTCDVNGDADGEVVTLSDGEYDRCISVITPSSAPKPMPVLFWFHGSGGNAAHCGNQQLVDIAKEGGFTLVCGEALQDVYGKGGQWNLPEVVTDETGTPCDDADSHDVVYIKKALEHLAASPDVYDTSKVFTSGCSMGSAFSGYISQCLKTWDPDHISAFATHSTGVKVKGDGTRLPSDWGECDDCQYWPFKPVAYTDSLGLKACVFDNTGDGDFYKTSQYLAEEWESLGNKVETHFESGGHCQIHSYEDIVTCLDDSTGRLLPQGPLPASAPSPALV
jgi:poly(3-hydroxybutyrate) depolymerase